ncbi:MAG: tRNA uridine-5-carboxymethylaminomethyl(34) synthesis enzyme MnmG, partial [Pseudomonadota bacterium]
VSGQKFGIIGQERRDAFAAKSSALAAVRQRLEAVNLTPSEAASHGIKLNKDGRRRSAFEILSYPEIDFATISEIWSEFKGIDKTIAEQVRTDARYDAYVRRQENDVAQMRRDEAISIPRDFDYRLISGLSTEVRQKLDTHKPTTIAQAGRIDGVTPAALVLLSANLRKQQPRRSASL